MDIRIVGGGPAGLYFAILMKRRDPGHRITIWEKNPPDSTFGWGLVFSEKTLRGLEEADPESYAEIEGAFQRWEDVVVVHKGEAVRIGGNRFAGLGRLELLGILQRRCEALGVEIRYRQGVEDPSSLLAADLLVGADGVGSRVRQRWEESFRPEREIRPNRYIWLGTPRPFDGLTLTFRQSEAGPFAAHSYKYSGDRSTFIVECTPEVMKRAGLEEMGEPQTLGYLGRVFAEDLDGAPLLSNSSRWLRFTVLKNERWSHENVVLLGDALHTAHFSIGSGTKLAMEDSIALAEAFDGGGSIGDALARFESTRKPVVEDLQRAARKSMIWFESFPDDMDLDPLPFAGRIMTRSPKVNMENLRRRDPAFVAAWEAWLVSG